ncbi:MAG: MarR family transcriptional regulator [Clostridia bacterium]|nr:MarR family transcriptional regulator [Clostridia bacterium]
MEKSQAYKLLRDTVQSLQKKLGFWQDNQLSCCGISLSQCYALVEIGQADKIALNELADLLNLDNSTMSRTVNNLVNNELVKREIDPQDRRYVTISLTESGSRLYQGIDEGLNLFFKNIYQSIPQEKQEQVLESLEILLKAIGQNECCN